MTALPWRVGELAARTGLSVRTLHHYDEIGLLEPSDRTRAGHRLYGAPDVARLQRIQALRSLGLSLDEVKRSLDGDGVSPRQLIDLQLAQIRQQVEQQLRLAERLRSLANHLDEAGGASVDELCLIIEAMTTMEKYFTTEQLETLRERRTNIAPEHMQAVQDEWAEIIPNVRAAMEAGVDPSSPEMLTIARRWRALVNEFTGGDAAIKRGVETMYANEGPVLREKLGNVPTPAMFTYMSKAFAALDA